MAIGPSGTSGRGMPSAPRPGGGGGRIPENLAGEANPGVLGLIANLLAGADPAIAAAIMGVDTPADTGPTVDPGLLADVLGGGSEAPPWGGASPRMGEFPASGTGPIDPVTGEPYEGRQRGYGGAQMPRGGWGAQGFQEAGFDPEGNRPRGFGPGGGGGGGGGGGIGAGGPLSGIFELLAMILGIPFQLLQSILGGGQGGGGGGNPFGGQRTGGTTGGEVVSSGAQSGGQSGGSSCSTDASGTTTCR